MAELIDTTRGLRRPPRPRTFRDRTGAGVALGEQLTTHRGQPDTVVLGLTNGGMVTTAAIARHLDLPLGVILVRRLRAPGAPRTVIGAVAEDGDPHLDQEQLWHHAASSAAVAREVARQRRALVNRRQRVRDGRPLDLPVDGTVILVDDGLTDGLTAMAAIRALRTRGVRRVVLAVPVAPAATADRLSDMLDGLVVLETPLECGAVGAFYEDFRPVSDPEVRSLLSAAPPSSQPAARRG